MSLLRSAFFLLFPGIVLLSSCSLLPTPAVTETRYYDLSTPEKVRTAGKVIQVSPFLSNSGERYKMALRKENRIESSDSCKWVLPPGSLMTKYFRLAFRSEPKAVPEKKIIHLSGTVSAFEMEKDEAILGLTYKLVSTAGKEPREFSRTILIRQKITGDVTPEAFARAMSKAAGKAAESIVSDLKYL